MQSKVHYLNNGVSIHPFDLFVGKWSPNGVGGDDNTNHNNMWSDVRQSRRSGSVQHESQPMTPVWTPRSAHSSPVASRKQFRPVQFQSPLLERKFTQLNGADGPGDAAPPPPWEQPGFDKLPPPVLNHQPHHHQLHQHQNHRHHHHPQQSSSSSSVRRLAQSFSAPKLNAGVVDGDGGHSESYSKHSRNYVCPPTRSLFEGNIESV